MSGRRLGAALAALGLALAAGCAPHRLPLQMPSLEERRTRFERALADRGSRARALDASVTLWAEVGGGRRLPGVSARLWTGAPDSIRLLVNGLLGPAVDACVRAESVTVWVPARRAAFLADAVRDSLGVDRPGAWLVEVLGARFRPPEEAWRAPGWSDSLALLAWTDEAGGACSLSVSPSGLPDTYREAAERGGFSAEYRDWARVEGVAWPTTLRLRSAAGRWQITLKVARVTFLPEGGCRCMAVSVPGNAERWTRQRLRELINAATLLGG